MMRHDRSRQARGTVILLVIAALALLAIIGTAYIVSARVDRNTARNTTDSINSQLIVDGALQTARSLMMESTRNYYGGTERVMPLLVRPWMPETTYAIGNVVYGRDNNVYCCVTAHTAGFRTGQIGAPTRPTATSGTLYWTLVQTYINVTPAVVYQPGECVLSTNGVVYQNGNANNAFTPPTGGAGWTAVPAGPVLTAFTTMLASRDYDYSERGAVLGNANGQACVPDQAWLATDYPWWNAATSYQVGEVVQYQGAAYQALVAVAATATTPPAAGAAVWRPMLSSAFSLLAKQRFDPSTGTYSLTLPTAAEVSAAVPTTSGADEKFDAVWYVLPVSSGSGVRYRVALRFVDTGGKLPLNSGQVWAAAPQADVYGEYLTGPMLGWGKAYAAGANDNLMNLHAAAGAGRLPGGAFTLASWQNYVLGFEQGGANAAAGTSALANWFDISDELELRSYYYLGGGYKGLAYTPRPASVAGGTNLFGSTLAAGTLTAPGSRRFYSARTAARQWGLPAANASPAQSISPKWAATLSGGATVSWPGDYKLLPLKRTTASTDDMGRNAMYLANLLQHCGFSDDEALSFAVNYLGQTALAANTSYIAPTGVTIANNTFAAGGATYAAAATLPVAAAPTKTYLAYSAQPFANEVAMVMSDASVAGVTFKEYGFEFYNPYSTAIDMKDWKIRIRKFNGTAWDVTDWVGDVGAAFAAAGAWGGPQMPGGAYAVVLHTPTTWTTPAGGIVAALPANVGATAFDPTVAPYDVTLERPFRDSTGTLSYMVVDRITVDAGITPLKPAAGGADVTVSKQRANYKSSGAADAWACTSPVYGAWTLATTLGAINDATITGDPVRVGVKLPDRFASATPPTADAKIVRDGSNIGDLMDYMHATCMYDAAQAANASTGGFTTIPELLADTTRTWQGSTSGLQSAFAQESKVRFDWLADPRLQRLARLVAQVDRASDGVDQTGMGIDSLEENRQHGRVNLNTATAEAMATLPPFINYDQAPATVGNPASWATKVKHVANVLAYRDRTQVTINLTGAPVTSDDFSDRQMYPGRGIRSLGELFVPLGLADGFLVVAADATTGLNVVKPATTYPRTGLAPTMLDMGGPTATWTKLFGCCTVRSDIFVVYGYVEALRANQSTAVVPAHNNSMDWYLPYDGGAANVSDDPASTTAKNIRIAKRRFVAVIDRSNSNYPRSSGAAFSLPRVLGVRELPQ